MAPDPLAASDQVGKCAAPLTVVVRDLHVRYQVYADRQLTLRRLVSQRFSGRESTEVHAVRGVTFDVHEGEAVGIVGSNGSGKSTLLAAIAGLLPPSSGEVLVRSQPSLLGINAALKPDLSGRRNIVIGSLAMGLPMDEVRTELERVAEYTELGDALDRPLRTYSSGMRSRLAFAIATIRTPDILLIDEALAVGDQHFRAKSLARVREMQAEAGTILMVTHNLNEIRSTCSRVIWLDRGELRADGDVAEVLAAYEQ